jgi:uncharacterized protein
VNYLSEYTIAFKGLKEGNHLFEFDLDDKFFGRFDNSEVSKGQVKCWVTLTKQTTLMILKLVVEGVVELQCDRCLEDYWQPVKNESRMYIKFGHEEEDNGDDIIIIPFEEYQVNVAQYLYELTILGLPIKHVHPDDENGNSLCDPEMLEKLNEYTVEKPDIEEEVIDDRWKELKKLLDNK